MDRGVDRRVGHSHAGLDGAGRGLSTRRGVITDIHQRTLVDFLRKRDKGTIARRIARRLTEN